MSDMEKREILQMIAALPEDMSRGIAIGVQIGKQMQQAETQAHAPAAEQEANHSRPA